MEKFNLRRVRAGLYEVREVVSLYGHTTCLTRGRVKIVAGTWKAETPQGKAEGSTPLEAFKKARENHG